MSAAMRGVLIRTVPLGIPRKAFTFSIASEMTDNAGTTSASNA